MINGTAVLTDGTVMQRVLLTREWFVVKRTNPAGGTYRTHADIPEIQAKRRPTRGRIFDIPSDPAELAAFKNRFPFSPFIEPTASQVFVPTVVTVVATPKGEFEYTYRAPDGSWYPPTKEYPGMALPVMVATSVNDFQKNISESISYCCGPLEAALLWDRKVVTLQAGQEYTVPHRAVLRHRMIVCEGVITHNDKEITDPVVLTVSAGDRIIAKSTVYSAEVWVAPE